nr:TonB-dependent receptor [Pseudoalteromonas phenolica]
MSGFYQLNDDSGLLFGVHQGFVPSSPKQAADIEVEKSVNYEFGGRFNDGITQFEAVAFFNDYSNLKESCGFSNCGIDEAIDQEFNGGEVDVYGLETQFSQRYPLNLQIDIPYGFVYTYTKGEFKTNFTSDFDQWGKVTSGDSLPYVPEHQFAFNIGLEASEWYTNLSIKNVSSMQERAGDLVDDNGDIIADGLNGAKTDSAITVDISAGYDFDKYGRIYLKIDNLLDEEKVVSRRPYGARPGKPRQVIFGYKYQF